MPLREWQLLAQGGCINVTVAGPYIALIDKCDVPTVLSIRHEPSGGHWACVATADAIITDEAGESIDTATLWALVYTRNNDDWCLKLKEVIRDATQCQLCVALQPRSWASRPDRVFVLTLDAVDEKPASPAELLVATRTLEPAFPEFELMWDATAAAAYTVGAVIERGRLVLKDTGDYAITIQVKNMDGDVKLREATDAQTQEIARLVELTTEQHRIYRYVVRADAASSRGVAPSGSKLTVRRL